MQILCGVLQISMQILALGYLRIILQIRTLHFANLRISIIMRNSALVCINVYHAEFYKNSYTAVKDHAQASCFPFLCFALLCFAYENSQFLGP